MVWKSHEFFCKQTRIGIIPTLKADPNIFLIALKQEYIDAQYVKLPYSMWPFSIFYVLLRKRRQNVQKLNNFKESTLLDAMQIKFHDLWFAAHPKSSHWRITTIPCGIPLRILNLLLAHNHNHLRLVRSPYNVIFCWLESCPARSLQAHSLRHQLRLADLWFLPKHFKRTPKILLNL